MMSLSNMTYAATIPIGAAVVAGGVIAFGVNGGAAGVGLKYLRPDLFQEYLTQFAQTHPSTASLIDRSTDLGISALQKPLLVAQRGLLTFRNLALNYDIKNISPFVPKCFILTSIIYVALANASILTIIFLAVETCNNEASKETSEEEKNSLNLRVERIVHATVSAPFKEINSSISNGKISLKTGIMLSPIIPMVLTSSLFYYTFFKGDF